MKSLNYALVSSLCALVIGILLVVKTRYSGKLFDYCHRGFIFDSRVGGDVELFFCVEDKEF